MFPAVAPSALILAMAFAPAVCVAQLSAPVIEANGNARPPNSGTR